MVAAKITIDMLPLEPPPAHELPGELVAFPSRSEPARVPRAERRSTAVRSDRRMSVAAD